MTIDDQVNIIGRWSVYCLFVSFLRHHPGTDPGSVSKRSEGSPIFLLYFIFLLLKESFFSFLASSMLKKLLSHFTSPRKWSNSKCRSIIITILAAHHVHHKALLPFAFFIFWNRLCFSQGCNPWIQLLKNIQCQIILSSTITDRSSKVPCNIE